MRASNWRALEEVSIHQASFNHLHRLPASKATVATIDGKYYELTYWEVGEDGSITGIGAGVQATFGLVTSGGRSSV
jgi:hypothetical protein